MTIIDTKHAPGAIGPYSQAYETNGLVITSGQLPVNPADGATIYHSVYRIVSCSTDSYY